MEDDVEEGATIVAQSFKVNRSVMPRGHVAILVTDIVGICHGISMPENAAVDLMEKLKALLSENDRD